VNLQNFGTEMSRKATADVTRVSKWILTETGWQDVKWTELARDRANSLVSQATLFGGNHVVSFIFLI